MSVNAQQPFADLESVTIALRRMLVTQLKQLLRDITDSTSIQARLSHQGLKKELLDRLLAHYSVLKTKGAINEYIESKRLLEKHYGSALPGGRSTWGYVPPQPTGPQASSSNLATAQQQYYGNTYRPPGQAQYPSPYVAPFPATSSGPSAPSNLNFQPARQPNFKPSPFLTVREWVGPAVICPENPSNTQRSVGTFKLQLSPANLEMLRSQTVIHQLRLFCTTKLAYEAAYNPNHPASVEFPLVSEVKVNQSPLTVNLRGKKIAAKVLAPEINKDKALYFGGQDNRIELLYQNTNQKYVLSVAICEVHKAETLARRIRKDSFKSRADVLGAMKRAAVDDDIEMGDVQIGLKCPLSYMRLSAPIRSTVCVHLSCFDALSFFSVNEQTPSWQCPICFKAINPDTLFLDGYVQDILDKVGEDEETVLIDSEGRWHTPNNKFASEDFVATQRDDSVPAALRGSASTDSDLLLTRRLESPGSKLKRETSTPGLATVPSASTSTLNSRGKPPAEVFEIDDDDDEIVQDSSSVLGLSENQAFSSSDTPLQALPSTYALPSNGNSNINGNTNGTQASRLPHSVASRLGAIDNYGNQRSESSNSARQSPSTPAQLAAQPQPSAHHVIDLTLSDSEDEEDSHSRSAPPRQSSNVPHADPSTLTNRPPSLASNANGSVVAAVTSNVPQSAAAAPRFGFPSAPGMSVNSGNQNGVTNGHRTTSLDLHMERAFAPMPNGRHTSDTLLSSKNSAASFITPPVPTSRRSSSSNDHQSSAANGSGKGSSERYEDEEEEEGLPLARHRAKKRQKRDLRVADEEEDNTPARPTSHRNRKSQSVNSDELQEDERAGLALSSSR